MPPRPLIDIKRPLSGLPLLVSDARVVDNGTHCDERHKECGTGPAQRPLAVAVLFLSLDATLASLGFEKIEGCFVSFFAFSFSIAVIIIGGFFLAKGMAEFRKEAKQIHVMPYAVSASPSPIALDDAGRSLRTGFYGPVERSARASRG
jgi:hypothetical protein